MKILIILVGNTLDIQYIPNIKILETYIQSFPKSYEVEIACISSQDDFKNYEDILSFKYKIINPKYQLDKICDFLSSYPDKHDWYIKIRPDVKLLDGISLDKLSEDSIHARAREYIGPRSIQYGCSVGGIGSWSHVKATSFSPVLTKIVLDDQVYIFHRNIVDRGAFAKLNYTHVDRQNETLHSKLWKSRGIRLNVIGVNMVFTRDGSMNYSGDVNPPTTSKIVSPSPLSSY